MSYNSYKPRYSLYQPVVTPIPVPVGGCAPHQSQYQRRSASAGNLYRAPNQSLNKTRSPRFAENGFVPAHSSANSSASLAASAATTSTSVTTNSTAAIPDRYHRQKHTPSLSTHSLPSLTPSIKSSDLDTSSTQTSTSSISSWTDEKDKPELPQIKESLVERISTSMSEPELSRAVMLSEQLAAQDNEVEPKVDVQETKQQKSAPTKQVDLAEPAVPARNSDKSTADSSPTLAAVSTAVTATTPPPPPMEAKSAPNVASVQTATPPKVAKAHPSQRTSNQAVEEALAKLNARGEQPPSAEPVRGHRRRSSADSRTSLILPSERRYDANREQREKRERSARNSPEQQHRPRSTILDTESINNPKTRSPVRATRPGTNGSAKTGPSLSTTPVRPPSTASIRNAASPVGQSRPPSISSMSTSTTTPRHSRTPSQFSMSQPIAYAPVRGEREPKPKFSQKIKSLFRRSTLPDSASISSNMSGMSGKSGLSSMSVRSTSSTFSFRSISQTSKRLFKKTPKIEVTGPTFEQQQPAFYQPSPPVQAQPPVASAATPSSTGNVSAANSNHGSRPSSRPGSRVASRSSSPTPNSGHRSASPIPIVNGRGSIVCTGPHYDDNDDDDDELGSLGDENLDVPDTLFPRSLDDVAAVANIRNSVERTASLDRKGSVRSVRSLHKPNDDEKVPNVQEVRMENPEAEEDDIFGKLDTSGIDLALPKHIKKRGVNFASQVMIYDTFSSFDYDRRPEPATCNRLTPALAQQIKQELNNVKMAMEVHRDSRAYTHFF